MSFRKLKKLVVDFRPGPRLSIPLGNFDLHILMYLALGDDVFCIIVLSFIIVDNGSISFECNTQTYNNVRFGHDNTLCWFTLLASIYNINEIRYGYSILLYIIVTVLGPWPSAIRCP